MGSPVCLFPLFAVWHFYRFCALLSGSTVSVSGDELLSRLSGGETAVGTEKDNIAERRRKLEVVESRWMGLKHTVRDTSRD